MHSDLDLTIRPLAGLEAKLEALDAEDSLAIGLSSFRDVFKPRERAMHGYGAIGLKAAKHAYKIANAA